MSVDTLPAAIAATREAIALEPELAVAHAQLAALLRAVGDVSGAELAAAEAARLRGDAPPGAGR